MNCDYFKLFPNVKITIGYKYALLVDLFNRRYKKIPLLLAEILDLCKSNSIQKVKKHTNNVFDSGIEKYLMKLSNEGWGLFSKFDHVHKEMENEWYSPSEITNIVIDISYDNIDLLNLSKTSIIDDINLLKCSYAEVRIFELNTISIQKILDVLLALDGSYLTSIGVFVAASNFALESLHSYLMNSSKISYIVVYSFSDKAKAGEPMHFRGRKISYTSLQIDFERECGAISNLFFVPNIEFYSESQFHNSCLNRKVSIDKKGNIKNCPSLKRMYGKINEVRISEVVKMDSFKEIWDISKRVIKICSDCEYRDICSDCRAYLLDPSDSLSKPLKCGYDPYSGFWEDWQNNPLSKKGIEYYGLQN